MTLIFPLDMGISIKNGRDKPVLLVQISHLGGIVRSSIETYMLIITFLPLSGDMKHT
jgi:hypothetical protein